MADPFRIVLVAPRNPLNIGAVARAMSNFGFTDLRLVNPYDVAFQQARSAVRAHYILESARVYDKVAEAVSDSTLVVGSTALGHRDLHVPLYRLEAAATLLREHSSSGPIALLFGSEKFGLSNEDISHCHWLLRIPTRTEHGSMNLGQAAAICFYELRRSEAAAQERFADTPPASADELERFTGLLTDALKESSYIHDRTAETTIMKIRRLVRRTALSHGDVETWQGMLRQILWKLRR